MTQKEVLEKVHSPEVAAKRGKKRSEWLKSGSPMALRELERIRQLNPMKDEETRKKVSQILRAMNHKPSVRGGNGTGMTVYQEYMKGLLSGSWIQEFAISLGKRKQGYPTHYKVDLGNPELKIAIEVDGYSHYSRKDEDKKKDAMLDSLGWKVLRFWNYQVKDLISTETKSETYIFTTLKQSGILLSV